MKKQFSILSAIAVLALAVISCGVQFVGANPTPVPQGPMPQNVNPVNQGPQIPDSGNPMNPVPQGPENGNPMNPVQGPHPNGGNPGEGNILSFAADRTTLNKGECALLHWEAQGGFGANLNGQPVERVGQQQVCPQQTTLYGLGLDIGSQMLRREVTITVNGGNQGPAPIAPSPTKKKNSDGNNNNNGSSGGGPAQIDLQATDMFVDPASLGYTLHIGVRNNGSYSGNITFGVTCAGIQYTSKSTKNNFTNLMYSANGLIYPFNANQERWTNTYIKLDKGTGFYELTCTLSLPSDTNASNNSVKKTLQINP